jgi:hypothetical protein
MKYLLLLLLSLPSFADFSDWSETEQKLWHWQVGLQTYDVLQTYDLIRCQRQNFCRFQERNPLFGKEPKIEEIILLKVVGLSFIYHNLDNSSSKNRTKDLWIINGLQFAIVLNNYEQGIRFKYAF